MVLHVLQEESGRRRVIQCCRIRRIGGSPPSVVVDWCRRVAVGVKTAEEDKVGYQSIMMLVRLSDGGFEDVLMTFIRMCDT